ncbi:MAG: magnesium chelatase [Firmicutes bacterium HGW-Firmicutes-15]|nr:MAG: magnesium chelatase [Firmicutes bacterium HGW-Firmicutes-15]
MLPYAKLERYEGNEALFELVMMSIVSTYDGEPLHIHAEGLRGTGKTTIMRAARDILPTIKRITGCIYNCDPADPHCPHHRNLSAQEIVDLGVEEIPMPFLEISHSAKVGTVAGSIDLAKLTDGRNPEARLLPGIIPQAHRGIIFIDEINRLADTAPEITDILLDVMGTKPGHLQIEEAGLPVVHIKVAVSVWAASNPDEEPGPLEEIRRQLSDRFDMVCYMGRPTSEVVLANILKENSHNTKIHTNNSSNNPGDYEKQHERYTQILLRWAERYNQADLPDFLRNYMARLYVKHNLESIRAIEAMQQGAVLYSTIKDRDQASINDVIHMLPLILKHRLDSDTLIRVINDVDVKSGKESMFSFVNKKPNKPDIAEETEYFKNSGRPLKELKRQELINTEKSLDFQVD